MFSSLRVLARRTRATPLMARTAATRMMTPRIMSSSVVSTSTSTSTATYQPVRSFTSEYDDEGFYSPQQPIIGQPAPHFKATAVVDGQFKEVSLSDYKGKYVVLFFYPLDFTFVCPTEIIAFSDRVNEFRSLNTEIVGVSIDSEFSHLAWTQQARKDGGLGKIQYPLLADLTKKISRDYGVLIEDQGFSLRGLFIIDPQGILRQITVNDTPIGRSVDETLRLIQAFQYHAKHGEVCPANWKPGADTIKTTAEGSKEFFKKTYKQ